MTAIEKLKELAEITESISPDAITRNIYDIIAELTSPENSHYQLQVKDSIGLWAKYLERNNLDDLKNEIETNEWILYDKKQGCKFRIIQINKIETVVYEDK